jgi:SAM-dependent methyltransferase
METFLTPAGPDGAFHMSLIKRTAHALERRLRPLSGEAGHVEVDPETGARRRNYRSYADYVRHQAAKLPRNYDALIEHDHAYECIVYERYGRLTLKGATLLCLGARLGGETRAFTRLGALAIGVDLEPGPENPFVLPGDVHQLQFADGVFDYAFTNILDHVLDLEVFFEEVERVLRPDGRLIVELADVGMGQYEVTDLRDGRVRAALDTRLRLIDERPITNKTDYTDWAGVSLIYTRV